MLVVLAVCSLSLCVNLPYRPYPSDRWIDTELGSPITRAVNLSPFYYNLLPESSRCYNNTHHVLSRRRNPTLSMDLLTASANFNQTTFLTNFNIHGCCPEDYKGCIRIQDQNVRGCCPPDRTCCMHEQEYVGCASHPNQCCGTRICPEGYGCCAVRRHEKNQGEYSYHCCSIPPSGSINSISSFCEMVDPGPDEFWRVKRPGSCKIDYYDTLSYCTYAINTTVIQGNSSVNYLDKIDKPRSFGTCLNCTQKCADLSECSYKSDTFLSQSIETREYALVSTETVNGCCPVGTESCHVSNRNTNIGDNKPIDTRMCVDATRNETCCGHIMCPAAMKCCYETVQRTRWSNNYALFNISLPSTYQMREYLGCCPEETDCCALVSPRSNNQGGSIGYDSFFCGVTYNGIRCAINIYDPAFGFFNTILKNNSVRAYPLSP